MNKININHLKITSDLISILIKKQFPEYSILPIKPVDNQGHDNRTFRLGEEMLIRMPSDKKYATKVAIEQKWLPKLAPNISLKFQIHYILVKLQRTIYLIGQFTNGLMLNL